MTENVTDARAKKFQSPGHYTDKDREKIPDEDFGDAVGKRYPIVTQADVHDAASLIGKAGQDKERIKARIIAIAKRKGFSLPDAWQGGDDNDRAATEAKVTRDATGTSQFTRFVMPSTVRVIDQERREFEVCATSEAIDTYQTVFGYEASKDAFQRWQARNIREMHQPIAAGRALDIRFDDADRKVYVRGRISPGAESTWLKLLDGTLQGASIGASNVKWEWRDIGGKMRQYATFYNMTELSLVDAPSNPDGFGVTFIRSAEVDHTILEDTDAVSEETRADTPDATTAQRASNPHVPDPSAAAMSAGKPTEHDPFANNGGAGEGPADALHGETPDGAPSEELDTDLRDLAIEGTPARDPGSLDGFDSNLRPMSGPPADATDQTFAAARPQVDNVALVSAGRSQSSSQASASPRSLSERVAELAAGTPAATQAPQIAPFGYGATAPAATHRLPTARELRQQQNAGKLALEAEVTRAGDAAEAAIPRWDPRGAEDFATWLARKQRIRGSAEQQVILAQQARRIASEAAVEEQRVAQVTQQQQMTQAAAAPRVNLKGGVRGMRDNVAQIRAAQAAQVALNAHEADVQRAAEAAPAAAEAAPAAAEAVAAPTDERMMPGVNALAPVANVAIVPTAAAASSGASTTAELGSGKQTHAHNHAHNSALVHPAHEHEHTHRNGTTHSHAHVHHHDHGEHEHEDGAMATERGADGADGAGGADGHSHSHLHLHDHSHFYRNAEPLDAALVTPEDVRNQGNTTSKGMSSNPQSPYKRQTMELETVGGPVSVSTLVPTSGSAQSAKNGKPQSPQMSVQSQSVGHLDLLNTEDANAIGFGVPAEVTPVATPADGQVTRPVGLHPGGHQGEMQAAGLSPANKDFVGTNGDMKTTEIPHGSPEPGQTAADRDDDLDYDGDEDARELTAALNGNGGRAAVAEETRVGARVSAESRVALHAVRDNTAENIRGLCSHCGCVECQRYADAIAKAALTPDITAAGEHDLAGPNRMAGVGSDATSLYALQRMLTATVARSLGLTDSSEQSSQPQTFAASLSVALERAIAEAVSPLIQRFADIELTLADAQRDTSAQRAQVAQLAQMPQVVQQTVAREVESLVQRSTAPLTAHLTELSQRLESVAEVASESRADVAHVREMTEQIAAQPAQSLIPPHMRAFAAAPTAGALRTASDPRFGGANYYDAGAVDASIAQAVNGSTTAEAAVSALQTIARQIPDAAVQTRIAALVMDLTPHMRSMIGSH